MEIGQKIKEARTAKGMTQQELGDRIGVQKSAIAKYESGRVVNIKRSTLQKIAQALDLAPSELIFIDAPRKNETIARADKDTANVAAATKAAATSANSAVAASSPSYSCSTNPTPERCTMRTFSKSTKLNNVLYDVRGPVVDEAARMEAQGASILKLNIGNPAPFGFRTPDEVVYDMSRQLTSCEGYSDAKGLYSAR